MVYFVGKNEPPITVLMSCFNGAEWIRESIESVLTQGFEDFELIVVDDGSTDDSRRMISKYATADNRVRLIAKDNTGLTDSLNAGLAQARGLWIARIDVDDVCHPKRLERQMEFVEKSPKTVLLGTGFTTIDLNGEAMATRALPTRHDALVKRLALSQGFFPHSSTFFRRDTVISIGGYRQFFRRSQDYDLWLRLSSEGALASIRESLVYVRKHPGQVSHDQGGFAQYYYSRAALLSHMLRSRGHEDPVDQDPDRFLEWIRNESQPFFQRRRLRTGLREISSRPWALIRHPQRLLSVPIAIRDGMLGDPGPKRLLHEWVERNQ